MRLTNFVTVFLLISFFSAVAAAPTSSNSVSNFKPPVVTFGDNVPLDQQKEMTDRIIEDIEYRCQLCEANRDYWSGVTASVKGPWHKSIWTESLDEEIIDVEYTKKQTVPPSSGPLTFSIHTRRYLRANSGQECIICRSTVYEMVSVCRRQRKKGLLHELCPICCSEICRTQPQCHSCRGYIDIKFRGDTVKQSWICGIPGTPSPDPPLPRPSPSCLARLMRFCRCTRT